MTNDKELSLALECLEILRKEVDSVMPIQMACTFLYTVMKGEHHNKNL